MRSGPDVRELRCAPPHMGASWHHHRNTGFIRRSAWHSRPPWCWCQDAPRTALKSVQTILNPRPEGRKKSKVQSPKPKVQSPKPKVQSPKPKVQSPKPEAERGSDLFRPSAFGLPLSSGDRRPRLFFSITAPRSVPSGSASRLLNRAPFNRKERKGRKEREADESALWFGTITSSFLWRLCVNCRF